MKKFLTLITLLFALVLSGCSQQQGFVSQGNEDFAKTISKKSTQLVDVRTPQEYEAGHIPGALNIDVRSADFDTQAAKLNKKKPVAVYCRSGVRSRIAASKMAGMGFTVYNLDKGINGWNGETVKGKDPR
jgi:rhodanese-related sulfurtransferase